MGQRKLDGSEELPVWEVVRTLKVVTSESLGDEAAGREDVTRTRKAKWVGEAEDWRAAIDAAEEALGEAEECDVLTLRVKQVGA